VFAPLISDWIVIILVLLILTNVPHEFVQILQCCGGMFLLYLAYGAYKTWHNFDQNEKKKVHVQQNIFKAVMVNFLNPNPYLGWSLVMGPELIKGWKESPANGVILLIAFYGTMVICSIGMVGLFAAARNLGQRVIRASIGISVIALLAFGVYQLFFGIVG
jgi:threonine/homoserine/homoserine lactone efflux protein